MFRFRLESVLNARKAFEDTLLREFSEKKRNLEKEAGLLEALKEERRASIECLREMQDREVTAADIGMYVSYIEFLHGRVDSQQAVVVMAQDAVEAKRQEVVEAVKKRKMLENLKKRQRREYEITNELRERKVLDEMSLQGFSRRAS
jgi:flagellar protein FliJ